jgi:hypothetical protein
MHIISLDHEVHYHQFAPHKDENRYGVTHLFEVQLASLSQQPIDLKELAQHQAVRIPKNQVYQIINQPLVQYVWDYYCYVKNQKTRPQPLDWIVKNNQYALLLTHKHSPYVLINFIPKHTNQETISQFHEWIQNYPEYQIINFPAEE